MTNYEKIKNMSVEEMALFLESLLPDCTCCIVDACSPKISCNKNLQKYLESEVTND